MMTRQARRYFTPAAHPGTPLRVYAPDSPQAKARLLVLALLADGHLDPVELECLNQRDAFSTLGISRADFYDVLHEFCEDLASQPSDGACYTLRPSAIATILGEVRQAADRDQVLRLMVSIMGCDGRLADGERELFWQTAQAWQLPLRQSHRARENAHGRPAA